MNLKIGAEKPEKIFLIEEFLIIISKGESDEE
jgi:hypothetical protein